MTSADLTCLNIHEVHSLPHERPTEVEMRERARWADHAAPPRRTTPWPIADEYVDRAARELVLQVLEPVGNTREMHDVLVPTEVNAFSATGVSRA